jgi:hypothetical protein
MCKIAVYLKPDKARRTADNLKQDINQIPSPVCVCEDFDY